MGWLEGWGPGAVASGWRPGPTTFTMRTLPPGGSGGLGLSREMTRALMRFDKVTLATRCGEIRKEREKAARKEPCSTMLGCADGLDVGTTETRAHEDGLPSPSWRNSLALQ